MLHACWRNSKYQFYCLWFDPIRDGSNDLLHPNRITISVSINLSKRFQRRTFKKNQKQELPVVAMLFNESGQNEQYL
jgi:hypothetical protein